MPHDPPKRSYSEAATPVLPHPRSEPNEPWLLGEARQPGMEPDSLAPRSQTPPVDDGPSPSRVPLAPVVVLAMSMMLFGTVIGFAFGRGQETAAEARPVVVEPTTAYILPAEPPALPTPPVAVDATPVVETAPAPAPVVQATVPEPVPTTVAAPPPAEAAPGSIWGPFGADAKVSDPPPVSKKKLFGKKPR